MPAPTIYFEYHSDDGITQFVFVPKTSRGDGTYTLPHMFSRTVSDSNPQRSFQRAIGEESSDRGVNLSPVAAATNAAPTLNQLMPALTLIVGDPRQKLYEHPVVVFISDAEIEEMADGGVLPRTLRDRIDRTRTSLSWADLPKRS